MSWVAGSSLKMSDTMSSGLSWPSSTLVGLFPDMHCHKLCSAHVIPIKSPHLADEHLPVRTVLLHSMNFSVKSSCNACGLGQSQVHAIWSCFTCIICRCCL